jgi:L-alanine-DL-glutamate epimerase-like enolase superfamily enzyme
MRIDDASVTLFRWDDIPPAQYGTANPAAGGSELGLLELRTDAGIVGRAFLGASFRSARLDVEGLVRHLLPQLRGEDPLQRERLFAKVHGLRRAATLRAIGACDVALWDIVGQAAGLPLHALMGGFRRKVPAYASSSTLAAEEMYPEQALRLRAQGYRAYKIHPPAGGLDASIRVCRAVRRAVGDDMVLMIDPAGMFRLPDAVRLGRVLEELRFHWYEDPLHEDDLHNYPLLRQKLDVPILATEYASGGFEMMGNWIERGATDYLRGDVAVKGGLTPCLKAAHLAEAFGMNFEVHHGGNSWNNVAQLHLIMAVRNTEYFEVLLPEAAQRYGLLRDIEVDAEGLVQAWDDPGVGAEPDMDLVRAKTTAVLR